MCAVRMLRRIKGQGGQEEEINLPFNTVWEVAD